MPSERIKTRIVDSQKTIIQTMKLMDERFVKSLLVFDKDKFLGMITNGDLQRAIIANKPFDTKIVTLINNTGKRYAHVNDDKELIKSWMLEVRAEIMPVLNDNGDLADIIFWNDLFMDRKPGLKQFNLPVVIMAGGKGERLKPLTNIFPKPLIPVGEKTIIETIMDKFVAHGCHDFHISVNYKADVIRNYFEQLGNPEYNVSFFQEDKPMGTAGSLRLLKNIINETFFVSNCDILINDDYAAVLDYHHENNNELTVVAAIKTYTIPYGTITTGKNGLIERIEEKPDLTFKINTGFYILEPSLLDDIPDDFFHITHLMEKLQNQGRRVGVYPISQNDWQDMGDWHEYLKMINVL